MNAARTEPAPELPGLLRDKVVLVAGIGPGLGRSLALRSAMAGAQVVLAARTEANLEAVADEVARVGLPAVCVPTDLTDDDAVARLVATAVESCGRVDALVHNAFAPQPRTPLPEVGLDDFRQGLEINLLAALNLAQQLTSELIRTRGSVVMINSMVLRNRLPGFGAYRVMKGALLSLARSLSVDLGPHGVRVNTVAPGYIWGPRLQAHFDSVAARRGVDPQVVYDETAADHDLRKLPEPDEIADAVVFLTSPMARAITGQCLDVTAGETHH